MLLAAFGPMLVRLTVKLTTSPTVGVGLSTNLVTARSASCGVTVALAWLFAVFGSNSVAVAAPALVTGAGASTRAMIVSRAVACLASVPTAQTPVAGV